MLPYQPNSDALVPPPLCPPPLPVAPVLPAPLSGDDLLVFALFFFSLLTSIWCSVAFGGLDLGCADGLVAFASRVFLGIGVGVGFGVGLDGGFGFGIAFGTAVS